MTRNVFECKYQLSIIETFSSKFLFAQTRYFVKYIHVQYLNAGADIIETNSFNATSVSQADYNCQDEVFDLNFSAANLARRAADSVSRDDKPRFVAGVLGPTSQTCSLSPNVEDPAFRSIDFMTLVASYTEAAQGLLAGGADILLIETVFDTLNAKAAIYALKKLLSENNLSRFQTFQSIVKLFPHLHFRLILPFVSLPFLLQFLLLQ